MSRRAQPALSDAFRQAQGAALEALGFGPVERAYEVADAGPGWRLRDYRGEGRPLLIVAAPIKRPYIWDLAPPISAVQRLLEHRLGVHLLEWTPPETGAGRAGLDAYVEAIGVCLGRLRTQAPQAAPILVGHSLGGTLAAIFAAFDPQGLGGLVLLGAPLCFAEGVSPFRDALVSIFRLAPSEESSVPGSVLTDASLLASPRTFVWSRLLDVGVSLTDPEALETHARVTRWTLDEAPLPGRLTAQILGWLYREDRFRRGVLPVKGRAVGPRDLSVPTLAVVNTADEIAPLAAVRPFLDAAPAASLILQHPGEFGVSLQHLALLIGRRAHAEIWPEILAWIDSRG